jgi:tetratricopeptide (TPR) repeat protein
MKIDSAIVMKDSSNKHNAVIVNRGNQAHDFFLNFGFWFFGRTLMKKFLVAAAATAVMMSAPAFAAATVDTGPAYQAMLDGKWSEAETALRQSLAENPKDASRLLNLAFVLQNTGRAEEAAKVYQQVLQLDQNPAVAVYDEYTLSKPARAKQVARSAMATIENAKR